MSGTVDRDDMGTKAGVAIRAVVGAGLCWLLLFGAVQAAMSVPRYELIAGIEGEALLDYSALPHPLTPLSSEYIAKVLGLGIPPGPSNATLAVAGPVPGAPLAASAPAATGTIGRPSTERTVVEHDATNDEFSDAYGIGSVPFTARTNSSGASREGGEPSDCAPAGGTLWYRFFAARPMGLVASTAGNRPASVAIYAGDGLRDLEPVGCDTDVTGRAFVAFAAERRTPYYIQVASPGGGGRIVFNLDLLGVTERVSNSYDGGDGNNWSYAPALSADARFVAFMSHADNLVRGDTNRSSDVFVYDRVRDRTELVSVDSKERQGNAHSGDIHSAISADGRYVAFFSDASNLVPRDRNDSTDAFVRDRVSGTTTRVSVNSWGEELKNCGPDCNPFRTFDAPPGSVPRGISITPDGRFVAFEYPFGLDKRHPEHPERPPPGGGLAANYVHDRRTGTTELVSVNSRGKPARGAPHGVTDLPVISADGRYVAFRSDADNLVCRRGRCDWDTNDAYDVFVRDRRTRKTERVSIDSGGNQQDGNSSGAAISADGRYVAFYSMASNLVPPNAFIPADTQDLDVFVHDRATGTTEIVSVNSAGEQQEVGGAPGAYGPQGETPMDQLQPAISADGRYVAFSSTATNLAANDDNGVRDIFLHDRLTGITTRVSVTSAGRSGSSASAFPALTPDARFVAFSSESEFVPEDNPLDEGDVFVHSLPFL